MNGPITLGGASIMGSLSGLAGLSRWWVRPARPARPVRAAGRHRAPMAPSEPGQASVEALVIEVVQCPVDHRKTRHVRFAVLNGLMCLDCGPWEA